MVTVDTLMSNSRPSKGTSSSERAEKKCIHSSRMILVFFSRVQKCKDFYEILSVTKEVGDTDLKKQYRRLALLLHPDKNKAPGAGEAFKSVGNAFAILSDVEKRKQYDLNGSEEATRTTSRGRRQGQANGDFYSFEGSIA